MESLTSSCNDFDAIFVLDGFDVSILIKIVSLSNLVGSVFNCVKNFRSKMIGFKLFLHIYIYIYNCFLFSQARATTKFDVRESVEVTAVTTSKKVADNVTYTEDKPKDVAKVVKPEQEATSVTEVTTQEVASRLSSVVVSEEKVAVATVPQEAISVAEVNSEVSLGVVSQEDLKKVKAKKKVTIQESVQIQEFEREEEIEESFHEERFEQRANKYSSSQDSLSITEV